MWQIDKPNFLGCHVTVGTYEFPWQTIGSQNFRAWQIDRVKFRDCHGAFVALGTYVFVSLVFVQVSFVLSLCRDTVTTIRSPGMGRVAKTASLTLTLVAAY